MVNFPPQIFGTLREHYLLLFGMAGTVAAAAGFVGAWVGAHFALRGGRRQEHLPDQHMRMISDGMDVLALEVERLSESQRYIARLLSERGDHAAIPPARREPGVITPH